ncbi:plasmid mobilization protein, partial [Xanthovirga aplysinae]|uniref:plasmid mobilization protein n=1 Tax=Xanthovirga aplysinae TaxID=2529853 RepID=UPI0012BC483D
KQAIKANAKKAKMNMTNFLIESGLNDSGNNIVDIRELSQARQQMSKELRRIGVNVNQIAERINATAKTQGPVYLKKSDVEILKELQEQLLFVRNHLNKSKY